MRLFDKIKSNILLLFYSYNNVTFGKNIFLESNVKFYKYGRTSIGNGCLIRSWSIFNPWGGEIVIGNNCSINSFTHISGNGGVYIGNNVLIATQCVIISADHIFDNPNELIRKQGEVREKIIIEDDVWLGAQVKVLKGVTIGKGAVVGAGAVVNKDIPPYTIAVGVPARVVKKRNQL